jgi:phosphatidylglycerophosphate synthase
MRTKKISYYIINAITLYRLVSAPFLLVLAITGQLILFKWLVAFSFLTDAIDGPLSRRYGVTSVFGSRLDSIADDATVLVSTLSLWIVYPEFVRQEWTVISILFALFAVQTIAALIVFKKVTSFHTYLAKTAAVVQALFFILKFFDFGPAVIAFYVASFITGTQLLEEIVLVFVIPEWRANVKGLFWVLKSGENNK